MEAHSNNCWVRFLQSQAQFHAARVDFITLGLKMGLSQARLVATALDNDIQRACKHAATAQGLYERMSKLLEQSPPEIAPQDAETARKRLQEALSKGVQFVR